jgi:hypothetical protein
LHSNKKQLNIWNSNLIGANGKMGKAALTGLGKHKVITAGRSQDGCDSKLTLPVKNLWEKLFKEVGHFAKQITVGVCEYATFEEMRDWSAWMTTVVMSKMMGGKSSLLE